MKIKKCCHNCKHYKCWDEEDCDWGCELIFDSKICNELKQTFDLEIYDVNDCKHYKLDVDRLSKIYEVENESLA